MIGPWLYVMSIVTLAANAFFVGYRVQTGEMGWVAFALFGVLMSLIGLLPPDHHYA